MTHVQRGFLQKWLPTISIVVALALHLIVLGRWTADVEARLDAVEEHSKSKEIHMPLDKRIDFFITRREAESADRALRETLIKIESKIDFLYEKAQGGK